MTRLLHLALAAAALSSSGAGELALFQEARQALKESVPQVAILKLRAALAEPSLPAGDKYEAALLLAESLAATGKADDALAALQPPAPGGDQRGAMLRARLLAGLGRWAEAFPIFHSAAAAAGGPSAALLGEAECLHALGNTEEAAALLEKAVSAGLGGASAKVRLAVLEAESGRQKLARMTLAQVKTATPEEAKWRAYAEGRLLLKEDQPAPALTLFEGVLQEREHLPENLLVAATFGATDARVALHGSEAADAVLETFIWRYPASPYLGAAFRRLDQIYAQEENAPESELHKWERKPPVARAALARFYVARMQARAGKLEKAAATVDVFLKMHPGHALSSPAYLLQGELLSTLGKFPEAVRALEAAMRLTKDPALRAEIELRTGLANFQQGEFLLSAALFEAAGRHSEKIRPVATFNAALAWLHQRNFERFNEQYASFLELQPESPLRGELLLEKGLVQARAGDHRAPVSLEAFARAYPRESRTAEARLAAVELAFMAAPEAGAAAAPIAVDARVSPETAAAADYLALFQADAQTPHDDDRVIAQAQEFLRAHPRAAQIAEVRMKLGQVYFRREDFANAESQFAELAKETPQSPYVEAALYLAGESAMKLINAGAVDRALEYFERVVKAEGKFKLYARQEQATVQSRLEHEDQAIALYELILGAQPPADPELRHAALCGKADNLLALGRRELPATARIDEAIAAYAQLASTPEVPAGWRNQALYKMGKALEQRGRGEESLAAFYDVLNRTTPAEREYFWFFKAGFDAARLFEQQEQWKSAAGIYQKMAKIEGPRTVEAQNRLRQLRLEHFLWD